MIKLQIIGNLGADCITKEVNGKNVINFNVAHSEKFKDSQGVQKEKTTWVNCAYWTDRTAVAQYLLKGKTIYAEGFPEVDQYTNKEGQPAATLRMRVMNLQLLGGNTDGQGSNAGNVSYSGAAPAPTQRTENTDMAPAMPVDDDLPF